MAEWFHAKVKFLRQMDNGLIKQISEQYLVDSLSFTETEARVSQEVGEGMREVTMMAITRSPIKEVVMYGDTDLFFKVKVQYSTMDEATEKEKKVTTYFLVNAANVIEATQRTEEHLKNMLVPFQIPKVEESPIVDVFEHKHETRRVRPSVDQEQTEGIAERDVSEVGNKVQSDLDRLSLKTGLKITAIVGNKTATFNGDGRIVHGTIDPADGQAHEFDIEDKYMDMPENDRKAIGAKFLEFCQDEITLQDFKEWAKSKYSFSDQETEEVVELLMGNEEDDDDPSIGLIDAVNEFFGGNLEAKQCERIIEQHRTLPEQEFRTWLSAAHDCTGPDCDDVINLIREG